MKSILLPLLSLFWLFTGTAQKNNEQLLRVPYKSVVAGEERDFFLYLPKNYNKDKEKSWPVLLFLHGNGERGNGKDELDFVMIHGPLYEAWIQKRDLPFIMIVPQLHMFGMGEVDYIKNRSRNQIPQRLKDGVPQRPERFATNYPMQPKPAVALDTFPQIFPPDGWDKVENDLLGMIEHVKANYRVDEKRLYLSGLSYGGFGTWYMASKHPNTFAAAVPVVAFGMPEFMEPIAKAQLPVWCFAGGRDPVVPNEFFYAGLNHLESLGHKNVRFTIEADMGHDAWTRVYGGEDVYTWLLSHNK